MEDQSIARIKEVKKHLSKYGVERELVSLHSRPIKPSRNSIEKRLQNSLKNSTHQIRSKLLLRNELRNLLIKADEIKVLPELILSLDFFSSFECCHILVHEKGKPVGINYFYRFADENSSKPINVKNFNNIFTSVKKSKNKNFNQSIDLKADLDLVGNFLAKEIDLKNHSVVFLISRNSFLPPSENEQESFFTLCTFLSPILNKLLDKEKNDFKRDILIKAIKNFPEKICIKDQERIIFNNDQGNASKIDGNSISFPLGGNDNLIMELSNLSNDTITSEIYHSQRINLLGELLNTLQHELSNPLFGLNLTSSLLKTESEDPDVLDILNDICQNAIRSQTIIKNFSNLYNEQQELKELNLISLIEETITLTKSESKEIRKEISCLNFERKNGLLIKTNPTYLTQIFFNLIINASQAIKNHTLTPHKHCLKILIEDRVNDVLILVIDDGPGIQEELAEDIFLPFFTTKESGTGLGLSICRNLATQLNAEINFKNNSPLPGATFSISLPK